MAGALDVTLQANLDSLPAPTRREIETAVDDDFRLETAGATPSASVRTADGRWVRIHSGRDPVAEAQRFVEAALGTGFPPVVIVVGPGLGYVIDILEQGSPQIRVILIEPSPAVARAMLSRRDWRGWIKSGRLALLVGPHYRGASDAWRLVDPRIRPPVIVSPVVNREFASVVAHARGVADQIILGAQANDEARRAFAGRYLLNTLANLRVIASEGVAADLAGRFAGVPAIVVAAGPSLDRNLDGLRALGDGALVIAVDTALRPLLAAGIRPHLVVAVDPSELNAPHLLGVPDTEGIWLAAEGSLHPSVCLEFAGRMFAFKVSDHHPWPWLAEHGCGRGTLRAWGSVLTTAFDLACVTLCDPIVFAGADLAYTDGLLYCTNTAYEHAWRHLPSIAARAEALHEQVHSRPTCLEPDVHGHQALTAPRFVQFRDWLVARAAEATPRRIMNATGSGILHGAGLAQVDLTALSFPGAESGDTSIRARLDATCQREAHARPRLRQRLADLLARTDAGSVPMATWLEFAGDSVTHEQIVRCLEASRVTLAIDAAG